MEMTFKILFFLVGGLWETEAQISVTGVLGGKVTITCPHANAFSNVKYFCKGECKYEDILISSTEKKDSNRKYSMMDDGNTFYVTIDHLTKEDGGTYWCGIERTGVDTYNKVVLTVTEGNTQNPDNDKKRVYIRAGLGVIVFALMMMVLVMFLRCRKRPISASSGKDHNATLSSQKEDAPHSTTCSSLVDEDKQAHGQTKSIYQLQDTSRNHTDNIYSNVTGSSEAPIQSDTLLYTTISLNKPAECRPVTSHVAVVTYATITHKSTDESALCCNV